MRVSGQISRRAVDAEGEVLEILVQSKRNKTAALRMMRKLLRKYGTVPPNTIVTDKWRAYSAALKNIGIRAEHVTGSERTTGQRTHTNRSGDENGRCSGSNQLPLHRNSSPFTLPSTTSSTSNDTSPHVEPFGHLELPHSPSGAW